MENIPAQDPSFSFFKQSKPIFRTRLCGNSASSMHVARFFRKPWMFSITQSRDRVKRFLALSLLMALVFGTNYHHFAVSLDDLALIAHGFYGRTYFHFDLPLEFNAVSGGNNLVGSLLRRPARYPKGPLAVPFRESGA